MIKGTQTTAIDKEETMQENPDEIKKEGEEQLEQRQYKQHSSSTETAIVSTSVPVHQADDTPSTIISRPLAAAAAITTMTTKAASKRKKRTRCGPNAFSNVQAINNDNSSRQRENFLDGHTSNEEVKMDDEEEERFHGDNETHPDAFHFGDHTGYYTQQETMSYETVCSYNTTTITDESISTPTISCAIHAEQIDEETLKQEIQERARQTILQRIQEETNTHAIEVQTQSYHGDDDDDDAEQQRRNLYLYRLFQLLFVTVLMVCAILTPRHLQSS